MKKMSDISTEQGRGMEGKISHMPTKSIKQCIVLLIDYFKSRTYNYL